MTTSITISVRTLVLTVLVYPMNQQEQLSNLVPGEPTFTNRAGARDPTLRQQRNQPRGSGGIGWPPGLHLTQWPTVTGFRPNHQAQSKRAAAPGRGALTLGAKVAAAEHKAAPQPRPIFDGVKICDGPRNAAPDINEQAGHGPGLFNQ